jgi:hypothetical protein
MSPLSDVFPDPLPGTLAALPLDPISPRLPIGQPFTPAMAARAGIGRAVLDRLRREGRVKRLVRGVYLDATVSPSVDVRAQALGLVVGAQQLVIGLTAAWLHGVEIDASAPPIEVHGRGRVAPRYAARPALYAAHDVEQVGPVRATTPLRTALDLGRHLAPDRALTALDGLLRLHRFSHTALMAEQARFGGQSGVAQLRELAAVADARATGPAESVLRLRWLDGRLPTPTPGLILAGPGAAQDRLALGLETHRFGAVLTGRLADPELVALAARGWRVLVLEASRILRSSPESLVGHLEREFHRHLLEQVG